MYKIITFLLIITAGAVNAVAEKSDLVFGVVDYFNYGDSEIIIDDSSFKMELNMRIYNQANQSVLRTALKNKQKILFKAHKPGTGKRYTITEIHFLPESAKRSDYRED